MILKYRLDIAACFAAGINVNGSLWTADFDPEVLSPEDRALIAERLDTDGSVLVLSNHHRRNSRPELIVSKSPHLPDLMNAIRENAAAYARGE